MRLKTIYILLALLLIPTMTLSARDKKKQNLIIETCVDSIPDIVLDTIDVAKKTTINDYSMIGVQYGAGLSQVMWNPVNTQQMALMPYNFGITFTRYGKMFGYMPYFGFQVGLFYGQEGYNLTEESQYVYDKYFYGAQKVVYDVIELPVLSHMHIDFWKMKIMAEIGLYGGYRLNIHRIPFNGKYSDEKYAAYQDKFHETENRWDYGIKGGVGLGLVLDPVEIHIKAAYKHALASLYEPNFASDYYYRYAYPSNIIISVGLHFQITKRTGKTKAALKKEAKELVYGTEGFNGIDQK